MFERLKKFLLLTRSFVQTFNANSRMLGIPQQCGGGVRQLNIALGVGVSFAS